MIKKSRYWSPSRMFELVLKIGKLDLTSELVEFNIITSIDLPYQTFILSFFIDPDTMILEQIYGQIPIKVTINLLATDQHPLESINFELMYLTSDMEITENTKLENLSQKQRSLVRIAAVARNPYITMNTFVNSIYYATTIENVIRNLVKKTNATLKYDSSNQNQETIDQILIPPSTLYKNLTYINRTFGLFEGIPAFYCSYNNVINIKNLTNNMKQNQAFTLYQLDIDGRNSALIDKCNDGKHFYTTRPISTKYEGNTVFAYFAPKLIYVVKPKDRLEHKLDIDLLDFTKKYGLISKKNQIFFDTQAIKADKRKTIYKDQTGYDITKTFINSTLSKKISSITNVTIMIEQSFKILNLMEVGEAVEVIYPSTTNNHLAGRYILQTSEIRFNKLKEWESSATLSLIRSNRTLT